MGDSPMRAAELEEGYGARRIGEQLRLALQMVGDKASLKDAMNLVRSRSDPFGEGAGGITGPGGEDRRARRDAIAAEYGDFDVKRATNFFESAAKTGEFELRPRGK